MTQVASVLTPEVAGEALIQPRMLKYKKNCQINMKFSNCTLYSTSTNYIKVNRTGQYSTSTDYIKINMKGQYITSTDYIKLNRTGQYSTSTDYIKLNRTGHQMNDPLL